MIVLSVKFMHTKFDQNKKLTMEQINLDQNPMACRKVNYMCFEQVDNQIGGQFIRNIFKSNDGAQEFNDGAAPS